MKYLVKINVIAMILLLQPVNVAMSQQFDELRILKHESEIEEWAKNITLGGNPEIHNIDRFGEFLTIVIARNTSGAASSRVFVFHQGDENYRLIATRSFVYGKAKIENNENGISFLVEGTPILSLSWMSLKLGPVSW